MWIEHVFSRNGQNTTSLNKTVIFTFHRGKLKAVYCTPYVTWTTSAKQLQRCSIKGVILLSVLQRKTAFNGRKSHLNMALGTHLWHTPSTDTSTHYALKPRNTVNFKKLNPFKHTLTTYITILQRKMHITLCKVSLNMIPACNQSSSGIIQDLGLWHLLAPAEYIYERLYLFLLLVSLI